MKKGYGDKLLALRGEKTIKKVADDLKISYSALAMYEHEERIPRDFIKVKIADYYHTTVQAIFFD